MLDRSGAIRECCARGTINLYCRLLRLIIGSGSARNANSASVSYVSILIDLYPAITIDITTHERVRVDSRMLTHTRESAWPSALRLNYTRDA